MKFYKNSTQQRFKNMAGFDASFEEGEVFNAIYSDAFDFVKSKYPWLSENDG